VLLAIGESSLVACCARKSARRSCRRDAVGWGLGFYGPPFYLHAVHESRGWSLNVVSTAVTVHFLFGAIVIANLPRLYRRSGLARVTKAGSLALAIGVAGWALAQEPWQLFVATLFSGGGWVTMGAAAVNAIVAPWFVRKRPAALASAYNGSSIGGVVFSPLWVAAIGLLGFPLAAIAIGVVVVATIWILADLYYSKTPESMGLRPDGDAPHAAATTLPMSSPAKPLPSTRVWRDWRLLTLATGMALGLFAQIGLLAHLFSLLVPALGAQLAGFAAGGATASAILGRTLVGWLTPTGDFSDAPITPCRFWARSPSCSRQATTSLFCCWASFYSVRGSATQRRCRR